MGIFASHAKSSKDNLFTSSSASLQVLPSQVKINCWPLPQHLCKSSSAIANLVPNTPSDDTLVQRSAYTKFQVILHVFFLGHYRSQTFNNIYGLSDQGGATGESKGGVLLRTQPAQQGVFHLRGWGVISTFVDRFTEKLLIFHQNESWSLIF